MTKFENKTTAIKGIAIDPRNVNDDGMVKPEEFACEISYTRVINEKTIEAVKNAMGFDACVMVSITSLDNEKAQPKRYSNGKIADYARAIFDDEESANNELKDGEIVRKFNMYGIEAQFWAVDETQTTPNYITDYVYDETPMNMTKLDMRSFLKVSAYNLTGYKVLGIHNEQKTELVKYAIITPEELEKCVITSKK